LPLVFSLFSSVALCTTILQLLVFYARFFNQNFLTRYLRRGHIKFLKHQLLSF
jgi:hypothetical protein